MVDLKVGMEASNEVVHATIVAITSSRPGWKVLTPEEIAIGCTGNPDDPYDSISERMEGCFVGKLVGKSLGLLGIFLRIEGLNDPNGFASTYREWHIFLRGFHSGFATELGGKFTPVPDMWKDEAQYYEMAQELGYITKTGKAWIPLTGLSSAAVTYILLNLDVAIPFILKFFNL
jgi:hypothetical protein